MAIAIHGDAELGCPAQVLYCTVLVPYLAALMNFREHSIRVIWQLFFYPENSNSELKFLVSTQLLWGGDSKFTNSRLKK